MKIDITGIKNIEVDCDFKKINKCKCGKFFWWAKTEKGNVMPISVGEDKCGHIFYWSHFCDCPNAKIFRKKI